jgi:hypothetical protein
MNTDLDFRVIPPIKKFSKFYNETVFEIPCKVLRIGDRVRGKIYSIEIERLDFLSGKRVKNIGITYDGTLELFNDSNMEPPFITNCVVRKIDVGKIRFIVYGLFNAGIIEGVYDVEGILNKDEDEIIDVFHSHYKELNKWLKEPVENNDFIDDLP